MNGHLENTPLEVGSVESGTDFNKMKVQMTGNCSQQSSLFETCEDTQVPVLKPSLRYQWHCRE